MDVKITLDEKFIPGEWYNIVPDLPFDLPPATSPRTGYQIGPHDLKEEKTILFALNAHGYFDLAPTNRIWPAGSKKAALQLSGSIRL